MAEEFTNKLNIMSSVIESGCNRSADVMCRLGGSDPCSGAELPDPVVYSTDMDPLAFLTEEKEIFVLESVVPVDRHYLPYNCGSAFPEWENAVPICGILRAGGIGAVYMENVDSEVWYKLLLNLIANAPCGIVRLRGGEAFKNSEFHDMAVDIVREAIEVAAKLGVDHLIGHVVPNAVKTSGLHYPSMAQDMMMKKAQTEIDFLNGAIERLGKQVGVPTPVNTTISRLVRTIESNYDRQYFPGGA